MARARDGRPGRERGAALVEMALVVGLLGLFLFGIITFGVTLSFKQALTQGANEAARAAAVAPTPELAQDRARDAVDRVLESWGVACDDGALTCSFEPAPCDGPSTTGQCLTVRLDYDLAGHPRVPSVPLVGEALPDRLVAQVVVQVEAGEAPEP